MEVRRRPAHLGRHADEVQGIFRFVFFGSFNTRDKKTIKKHSKTHKKTNEALETKVRQESLQHLLHSDIREMKGTMKEDELLVQIQKFLALAGEVSGLEQEHSRVVKMQRVHAS